jgi:hypothetical protein
MFPFAALSFVFGINNSGKGTLMNFHRTVIATGFALLLAVPATTALAQQVQKVSFKTPAANTKYTQQHSLDVGDVPGHQIRIYELHRTYPNDPPVIGGLKLKESWGRNISDYTDSNGPGVVYTTYVMENGDKFSMRGSLVATSSTNPDGSKKSSATTVGTITGGTVKFTGMTGIIRTVTAFDIKAGINEGTVEIEYTIK